MLQNIINKKILRFLKNRWKDRKVGTIISIVLYAIALAIGILGAIFYYLEMEFFVTDAAILMLFIVVFFVSLSFLNSVDID